jgi:hypothetical protein
MGQKQTSDWRLLMSALPPKADIGERNWDVRPINAMETLSGHGFHPLKAVRGALHWDVR